MRKTNFVLMTFIFALLSYSHAADARCLAYNGKSLPAAMACGSLERNSCEASQGCFWKDQVDSAETHSSTNSGKCRAKNGRSLPAAMACKPLEKNRCEANRGCTWNAGADVAEVQTPSGSCLAKDKTSARAVKACGTLQKTSCEASRGCLWNEQGSETESQASNGRCYARNGKSMMAGMTCRPLAKNKCQENQGCIWEDASDGKCVAMGRAQKDTQCFNISTKSECKHPGGGISCAWIANEEEGSDCSLAPDGSQAVCNGGIYVPLGSAEHINQAPFHHHNDSQIDGGPYDKPQYDRVNAK